SIIRETVDIAGSVAGDIPFAGELMHKGANTITEILIDKGHKRQLLKDIAQLEDPIGDLTKAFVKSLNQIADTQVGAGPYWRKRQRRIILFFDTYERLANEVTPWLLDYFLEAP